MTATINSCDVTVYTPRPAKYRFRSLQVKKYNSKRLHKKDRTLVRRFNAREQSDTCSRDSVCKCSACDTHVSLKANDADNESDFWESFDFDEYTKPTGLDSCPYDEDFDNE